MFCNIYPKGRIVGKSTAHAVLSWMMWCLAKPELRSPSRSPVPLFLWSQQQIAGQIKKLYTITRQPQCGAGMCCLGGLWGSQKSNACGGNPNTGAERWLGWVLVQPMIMVRTTDFISVLLSLCLVLYISDHLITASYKVLIWGFVSWGNTFFKKCFWKEKLVLISMAKGPNWAPWSRHCSVIFRVILPVQWGKVWWRFPNWSSAKAAVVRRAAVGTVPRLGVTYRSHTVQWAEPALLGIAL